jgi:hypothetical protein
MNSLIPVYRPDGRLYDRVNEAQFMCQEASGTYAKVVRRRKGLICRAILRGSPDDPTPPPISTYQGTRFVFREKLESGLRCWRHKDLDVMLVEAAGHRTAQ